MPVYTGTQEAEREMWRLISSLGHEQLTFSLNYTDRNVSKGKEGKEKVVVKYGTVGCSNLNPQLWILSNPQIWHNNILIELWVKVSGKEIWTLLPINIIICLLYLYKIKFHIFSIKMMIKKRYYRIKTFLVPGCLIPEENL